MERWWNIFNSSFEHHWWKLFRRLSLSLFLFTITRSCIRLRGDEYSVHTHIRTGNIHVLNFFRTHHFFTTSNERAKHAKKERREKRREKKDKLEAGKHTRDRYTRGSSRHLHSSANNTLLASYSVCVCVWSKTRIRESNQTHYYCVVYTACKTKFVVDVRLSIHIYTSAYTYIHFVLTFPALSVLARKLLVTICVRMYAIYSP